MLLLLVLVLAAGQPAIYGRGSASQQRHMTRLQTTPARPSVRRHGAGADAAASVRSRRPEAANGLTSVISRDASVRTNVIVS